MEAIFPQILFLGPYFAPFILRVSAAIIYALTAYTFYTHRAELASMPYPIIGKPGTALSWFAVVGTAAIAILLATGIATQLVAALACAGALKCWYFGRNMKSVFPIGGVGYFLLAVICLTLIATGPGAFAFDKPY